MTKTNNIQHNLYIFLDDLYDYVTMLSLSIPIYGLYLLAIGSSHIIIFCRMAILGICYVSFYYAFSFIRNCMMRRKIDSNREFYYNVIQQLADKHLPSRHKKTEKLKKDFWIDMAVSFIENYVAQQYNIKKRSIDHNKNKTSIYVAGSWVERNQLKEIMNQFRSSDFDITSDWPDYEQKHCEPYECSLISGLDFQNIKRADVVVAVMTDPEYPYRGTNTEIGYAIGSGKKVIIVCDGKIEKSEDSDRYIFSHACMSNVFFWDKTIQHVTCIDDAIKVLNGEYIPSPYSSFYSVTTPEHLKKYLNTPIREDILYVTDFL